MDGQSESCEPPPCDLQPPGKIRKALKMLGKRRQGGGMASIFSMRGKSDAGLKSSRSNTAEGLDTVADAAASEADAESLDLDPDCQRDEGTSREPGKREGNLASSSIRQSISSITSAKSLSFLTMIKKSRRGGQRQAQTESLRPGQTRKGIKGLFGNMRWPRRDKEPGDGVAHDPGPPLLASRSNSVEIMKENLTITPGLAHISTGEAEPPTESQDENPASSEESSRQPTSDRLSSLLGDISSILNIEKTEAGGGMMAAVEAEWAKVSHRVEDATDTAKDLAMEKAPPSPTHVEFCPAAPRSEPVSVCVASPRPTPSPTTTKQALYSTSTLSPTAHPQHAPTPPVSSSTTKPALTSIPTPKASPTPVSRNIPVSIPVPSTSLISTTISSLIPASPPTPEPSPKPSPESTPVDIPATPFSITSYQEPVTVPEPSQLSKSKSGPKYPPFITSTKPMPAAPVARPKIVTTFGLSTSRNTAPISKPDMKQSAPQTKSSPPASVCAKTPTDPESGSNSSPSVVMPAPFTRPPSTKGEKEQQNISSRKGLKETPAGEVYARATPFYKPVKPPTLSKIPVSGGVRPKQPPKDSPPNTSNGHSNLLTPVEDEGRISFSRESSSRDLLSDASTQSGAVSPVTSHEDILELSTYTGTGAASLPRESKIPIKHGSTAIYTSLQGKTETARSKIPVSKVPVRRTGTKQAPSQK